MWPIQTSLLILSVGVIALFEKIMMERLEPIFIGISNIGEDVQYSCFNQVYDVKSLLQPGTTPLFEDNY